MRLTRWWSEPRCTRIWGDLVQPDAHARLTHPGGETAFFLEYDTGTEPHARLAAKLDAYAEAAHATGARPLVLFSVHSARREAHLHQRLGHHPALAHIAAATTARDLGTPDRPVWLPLGHPAHRTTLPQLPDAFPATHRPDPDFPHTADPSPLPAPSPTTPETAWPTGLLRQP